jgi:hypothetical protein
MRQLPAQTEREKQREHIALMEVAFTCLMQKATVDPKYPLVVHTPPLAS